MDRANKQPESAPRAKGKAPETFESAVSQGDLDRTNKQLSEVQETNRLIGIVLFIGFIGILLTIMIFAITTIISDTASRDELKAQVQELTTQVQDLNARLK